MHETLLFVPAFSDRWPSSAAGRVKLVGATDNLGNSWILSRPMSTKFPILLVLGELAVQLRDVRMQKRDDLTEERLRNAILPRFSHAFRRQPA